MILPERSRIVPASDSHIRGCSSFSCGNLVQHIQREIPLCYLRWSHGEYWSMLPGSTRRGVNADKHRYYYETMGVELRQVLFESLEATTSSDCIRVEFNNSWTEWEGMKIFEQSLPERYRPWIVVDSFWTDAVKTGDVFSFLDAMQESAITKILVACEQDTDVADSIGATLIAAPRPNAYLVLDDLVEKVRSVKQDRPCILISCIGMPSGCLIWRLWDKRSIMVDCGHVCDALMGRRSRHYLRGGMARVYHRRFRKWLKKSKTEKSVSPTSS